MKNAIQPNQGENMLVARPYLSVVIPAYNEERRLSVTLGSMWRALRRRFPSFEMIVVNDGSIDGTAAIVESFSHDHLHVRMISYAVNRGKGYAVRQGVLASRGKYVLFCDADQSTPLREVRKLLRALEHAEIAIGSRAIRESMIIEKQPVYRMLMGKTFNKIVQVLALPGVWDSQCGFKIFKRAAAKELFGSSRIEGFSFDVEILFLARKRGFVYREVGVKWVNSLESKVNPIIHSLQMLKDLISMRCNYFCNKYAPYTIKSEYLEKVIIQTVSDE